MVLDNAACKVLTYYCLPGPMVNFGSLGNLGGFSGACLWRVTVGGRDYCLRAWPPKGYNSEWLDWLHHLMALARKVGLIFVPVVVPTAKGTTFVSLQGRLWELTSWMPGQADFQRQPSKTRLRAACIALGRLHQAWASQESRVGPCPAVQRRLNRAATWSLLSPTRLAGTTADPVELWANRAWHLLPKWIERVPQLLHSWKGQQFNLHPCLCDVWNDHVLFSEEAVSGLVDFGSVRIDHASVDLARLLGSLVGDDREGWEAGLDAYKALRPLSLTEQGLARALDQTGTILGMANWLRWLYLERRVFVDRQAVADRLGALVRRIEGWG